MLHEYQSESQPMENDSDTPKAIVPPLTNGGTLRSMDNRQLAAWLAREYENTVKRGAWSEDEYFRWLSNPTVDNAGNAELLPPNASEKREAMLHSIPTCKLVAELRAREGVEATVAEPYFDGSVRVSGPAVVLVVTD